MFQTVTKRYGDGQIAVNALDLGINDGEFVVLVGPSGCGKSTALRMVAGLEDISGGRLLIGGQVANDLAPRDRNIAMVFQSYALYPHLTVAENIGFGLRVRGADAGAIAQKVDAAAQMLELEDYLGRKPAQLSGGQRQRVAMGRAIVREPQAFLMDEPLSNLDARLRGQMRTEIARIQKMTGVTTIYVTHDQVEAMTMGDKVAVMNRGVLQQFAPPRTLYDEPANIFVASFIGSPPMNLIEGQIVTADGGPALMLGASRIPLTLPLLDRKPGIANYADKTVVVGIRPEGLQAADGGDAIRGTVAVAEDLGSTILVHLDIDAPRPHLNLDGVGLTQDDEAIAGKSNQARIRLNLPGRARVRTGETLSVRLDLDHLHLFDPSTGAAIE
ncbi:MAG TPA: sn-glycerol-3-phosphate ABC transporter ATP-binding protein UgpC [Magnetospirillaceae bacterium]